jgi:hypothetical protein
VPSAVSTSDYFGGAGPSPSGLLRLLAGALYDAGRAREEIRAAMVTNRRRCWA